MSQQHRFGIEFISAIGMPPVEFLHLAKALGAPFVSMSFAPMGSENPHGFPAWSLREDAGLRRAVRDAATETGVRIATGEAFMLFPGGDFAAMAADMDIMAEIGAGQINMLSFEPDTARVHDQCAIFAEMASARGMNAIMEYMPGRAGIRDLATALDAARHTDGRLRVMVDAMHFYRSGSAAAELAAADPALIGHIQLCDVPLATPGDYGNEALYHRLPPGEGELPLADFLAAAPEGVSIGLELPMLGKAQAGIPLADALTPAIAASVALLAKSKR